MVSKSQSTVIIAVLALLSIFPPLATDMYLPALGAVASDLNTQAAAAEISLSIFFLGLAIGQLIMGPLIDGYGRKIPLLLGTLIFVLTSIALIFTQDIHAFNALRFLQALGACAGMVISRAIVTDLFEGQQAAKNMTVLVMLMTIGPIISPTLGSLIYTGLGWRSIFTVMVVIGVIALLLSQAFIPETLSTEKRTQKPFPDALKNASILIKQRRFMVLVLTASFVQAGMFAFITGSSGVFQGIYGLNALHYGLAFAAIALSLFIFGSLNKKLLDHYRPAKILSLGLPVYVVMACITAAVSGSENIWIFTIPLWFTIGFVSLLSSNAIALAMGAAAERAGAGSAVFGVFQFGIAFIVSSCVAVGGSNSALPMSLGILLPALLALIVWSFKRPD